MKKLIIISLFIIGCTTDGQEDFITINEPNIGVPGTPSYTLTATAGAGGSVSPTSGSFNSGTEVTITATANSGYIFESWSNGSTENPITVTLNSNTSISASFAAAPTYTITLTANAGGSVSGAGSYQQGELVTLVATPDSGYKFVRWSDGSDQQNRTIPVIQNLTLNAIFTQQTLEEQLSDPALQTSTDINFLLDAAYLALDGNGSRTGGSADWHLAADNWFLDIVSDDAHKGSTDGDQPYALSLELFNWIPENDYLKGKWNALMHGVNMSNAVINVVNNLNDQASYNVQYAQARFLRGHYNFELQKIWVNVPYVSEENYAANELIQPNDGPIWDKIEADFSYAADHLPDSRGGQYNVPGRPIKTTAKAYLGKALLYQGKWNAALSELQYVINSGQYALQSDYFANFRSDGENGSEMVFSVKFTADSQQSPLGRRGSTLNYPIGPMTGGMCCGFYQPSQNLANAFQTDSNGLPLSNWVTSDIANDAGIMTDEPFILHTGPLDPRIDFTIARRGIEFNGYGIFTGKENIRAEFTDISGPYVAKKHMYTQSDPENFGVGGWGEQRSGIDYHVIRYADVLLMAAEASVELGSLETARGYVNQVRSRAKNSPRADESPNYVIDTYNSTWTNTNTARSAVRHERRVELGMEGHRLFDLRRWGAMVQVLNQYIEHEGRTIPTFKQRVFTVQYKHQAFPIPLDIILSSEGVITQNPGY